MERYGMFRPAALSWWRIRTERGTSLAIPQRGRPLFGLRCQTASICHPGNPLAAVSGRPEGDLAAVSTLVGVANVVLAVSVRGTKRTRPCISSMSVVKGRADLAFPSPEVS